MPDRQNLSKNASSAGSFCCMHIFVMCSLFLFVSHMLHILDVFFLFVSHAAPAERRLVADKRTAGGLNLANNCEDQNISVGNILV